MDKGLTVVIGMSIAYVASFLGMFLAWHSFKKRRGEPADKGQEEGRKP
jgi:hypothetical protein